MSDRPSRDESAVILLSGGLDSTVNAAEAAMVCRPRIAFTCDYGQRASENEIGAARRIAESLGIPHKAIDIRWLGEITRTSLIAGNEDLPAPSEAELDDPDAGARTADAVWVPNRNGVLLNVAAALAESLGARWVIPGFNAEEASTFPDNSKEFVDALNRALGYSTRDAVQVHCFTAEMTKREVFLRAKEIDAPVWLSWSCYRPGEKPCGRCESCMRFKRGLSESGCEEWFQKQLSNHA